MADLAAAPPPLAPQIFFLTTQVTSHRHLDMRVTSVNQLAGQAELHMLQLFVQWDANVIKPVGLGVAAWTSTS